jgi:hypothetical protein
MRFTVSCFPEILSGWNIRIDIKTELGNIYRNVAIVGNLPRRCLNTDESLVRKKGHEAFF